MTAKQLIRFLKAVPPDAIVVFGAQMLKVLEKDNPAFAKPLKQYGVGTDVVPILHVSYAEVDEVNVAVLSFENPEEDKPHVEAESYWVVGD